MWPKRDLHFFYYFLADLPHKKSKSTSRQHEVLYFSRSGVDKLPSERSETDVC